MENVVEVKNLVKRYKERVALDHLNLEIRKGEILVCWGPTVPARQQPLTVFCRCFNMTRERSV